MAAVLLPTSGAWAWCEDGCDCCRCPGEAQCLGNHSSCEEACGLSSPNVSPPPQHQPSPEELAAQERRRLRDLAIDDNNEAVRLQNNGDLARAIPLYEEAARLDPENAKIRDNLARARASLQWQQDVEAARLRNQEYEREKREATDQHNRTAARRIPEFAAGLGVSLAALNTPTGRLQFISAVPGAPSCADVITENAETLRWADRQAREQGWSFFRDAAGITSAVDDARQGATRKLGADELKKAVDATRERLDQARAFKAFMERVRACVGQEAAARTGCLVALAAEKSEEPAKEWLKRLLSPGLRDAAERAEKAGRIYQQYVERLEAAAQQQALAASRCQP